MLRDATASREATRKCDTGWQEIIAMLLGVLVGPDMLSSPFVIRDAKAMNKEWSVGEVPGTTYGLSSKGWVNSEHFCG